MLPGQKLPPIREKKPGAKWSIDETGEQGYTNAHGEWVSTGWHDDEGFWFEAQGKDEGHGWEGTGYYDVYDAQGEWAETGALADIARGLRVACI